MTAAFPTVTAKLSTRYRRVFMAFAVLIVLAGAAGPLCADVDDEDDVPATTELRKKENERDVRRKEVIQDRQNQLKSDRQTLKFEKRTRHPFKRERTLRRDIRRNEQRQNWNKSEIRRLEHRHRRNRNGSR